MTLAIVRAPQLVACRVASGVQCLSPRAPVNTPYYSYYIQPITQTGDLISSTARKLFMALITAENAFNSQLSTFYEEQYQLLGYCMHAAL